MPIVLRLVNYLKSKFRFLLLGFILVFSFTIVQYLGQYESFVGKYGTGLGLSIPLVLIWYWLEKRFQHQVQSDHQRSAFWILLFLIAIPLGVLHILKKELSYPYYFPMCDCAPSTTRQDRVGAICTDNFKSYSTGRGTCSEHNGVKKWQCKCE